MSEHRKNLQAKQPHIEYEPEGNGWPEPLTDPSSPIKIAVTNGKNGEQSNFRPMKTSTQS